MHREIRHIVFDVGRVLLHWDPELAYLERLPDPDRRRRFLSEICSPAWNLEQDRGRSWQEAEALLIGRFPEHAEDIRAYRANWHAMVPHALEESVSILEELAGEGWDVTLLTNFAADTFAEARRRFAFFDVPRGATVSGEIGFVKPAREIYAAHETAFGLDPAAILFIDDSQANVDGAVAAGWKAIRFTDAPALRAELQRRGIFAARDAMA